MASLSTRERAVLLNAPDNYRGAYLFRNGLDEALRIFQSAKEMRQAHVVAFHGLESARDEVQMVVESGTALSLELMNKQTAFERIDDAPEGCAKVISHSRSSLRVRLDDCVGATDVFYFTAGRIYRVPDNP